MLLTLDDERKTILNTLHEYTTDALCELCGAAVSRLHSSTDGGPLKTLAQNLGVDVEMVEQTVNGLVYIFTEAAKHNLKDIDLHDSLISQGLPDTVCTTLTEQYTSNLGHIRTILADMAPSLPHYDNLQWRLDIQLASRSLHHQMEPQIVLKLATKDGEERKVSVLQTDPTNLLHLTQSLEQALQEVKSAHCRRIQRNI